MEPDAVSSPLAPGSSSSAADGAASPVGAHGCCRGALPPAVSAVAAPAAAARALKASGPRRFSVGLGPAAAEADDAHCALSPSPPWACVIAGACWWCGICGAAAPLLPALAPGALDACGTSAPAGCAAAAALPPSRRPPRPTPSGAAETIQGFVTAGKPRKNGPADRFRVPLMPAALLCEEHCHRSSALALALATLCVWSSFVTAAWQSLYHHLW